MTTETSKKANGVKYYSKVFIQGAMETYKDPITLAGIGAVGVQRGVAKSDAREGIKGALMAGAGMMVLNGLSAIGLDVMEKAVLRKEAETVVTEVED